MIQIFALLVAGVNIGLGLSKSFSTFQGLAFVAGLSGVGPQFATPLLADLAPPGTYLTSQYAVEVIPSFSCHVEKIGSILGVAVSGLLAGMLLGRVLSGLIAQNLGYVE